VADADFAKEFVEVEAVTPEMRLAAVKQEKDFTKKLKSTGVAFDTVPKGEFRGGKYVPDISSGNSMAEIKIRPEGTSKKNELARILAGDPNDPLDDIALFEVQYNKLGEFNEERRMVHMTEEQMEVAAKQIKEVCFK
jgi:hypothetical protein